MVRFSTCILFAANSTPIVDLLSRLNSFRVNRDKRLDFPTPESPIKTTKKIVSNCDHSELHSKTRNKPLNKESYSSSFYPITEKLFGYKL